MALPQRKFREIVFQIVYIRDFNDTVDIKAIGEKLKVTKKDMRQAAEKAGRILEHLPEIDRLIAEASTGYELSRIASVERNILRVGVFEILYDETVPPKVALSEAVRLCRKYSNPESGGFVNGVLDAIHKKSHQAQ